MKEFLTHDDLNDLLALLKSVRGAYPKVHPDYRRLSDKIEAMIDQVCDDPVSDPVGLKPTENPSEMHIVKRPDWVHDKASAAVKDFDDSVIFARYGYVRHKGLTQSELYWRCDDTTYRQVRALPVEDGDALRVFGMIHKQTKELLGISLILDSTMPVGTLMLVEKSTNIVLAKIENS
jgi:hypothetical protein